MSFALVWIARTSHGGMLSSLTFCAGQTGLGKSTLINTIFASHLIDSKGRLSPTEPVRNTTEIQSVSHGALKFRVSFVPQSRLIINRIS